MRIAYFDCFSGISGDMVLGALIDAGLDVQLLRAEIAKLGLPDVELAVEPAQRLGIAATRAVVRVAGAPIAAKQEHHLELHGNPHSHDDHREHHHLPELLSVIHDSDLDPETKTAAERIFRRLAEAEASVHGLSATTVHLHEVGARDAVVDVVGAVAGLRLLGVDAVFSSPLRCGTGFVDCAHGRYPVPVPAVVALCEGIPVVQTNVEAELVTPTGAAIVTSLATFASPPAFAHNSVGYGAGRRDLTAVANVLRLRIGETADHAAGEGTLLHDEAVLVEANIDDMNPEIYGYLFDLLLEGGARDVFVTPIQMKKGRPGNLLSVLVDPADVDDAVATLLTETTTIGVRFHSVERRKLQRSSTTVETEYGPVRVKVCHFDDVRRQSPEFEDCAMIARQRKVPILSVYEAARTAISNRNEP